MGRKARPIYAVVAADSRSPRDGRYIEDLGRYNPIQDPAEISLKEDRVLYWLSQGAQPTDTVRSILSREGLMLAAALSYKGKPQEEIDAAVQELRERRSQKVVTSTKMTPAQRRRQVLEEERKRVMAEEADRARERAAQEAEAKAQEEEARRRQAEERAAAQAAAQAAEEEAAAQQAQPSPEAEAGPTLVEEGTPAANVTPEVEAPATEAPEADAEEKA